ncbi:albumin-2-like [Camellia sinensis]|uniref:albumin-2-like n=1 Tax=Camellia sinensis TaxID=4442 RepID=UPI00103552CA|nr:albumin-2-like [Camellia sinensis]
MDRFLFAMGIHPLLAQPLQNMELDCAFGSHNSDEAFIFSGNLCAQINYAPDTKNDKIIKGPMTITAMFPFLKETVFKNDVDAAFEATTSYEAYLFKDNHYALINYGFNSHLIAVRTITQGFASLRNTMFESGIDAAFASHRTNEAYLFKKDYYALINFAPGTTDDYIIDGVKKIRENWPSLTNILPRKNYGLDVHDHTKPAADHDQDEL